MMSLRSWMEKNGVSRQHVADEMGITVGHLRTLINANRTASQNQVNIALALINGTPVQQTPQGPKPAPKSRKKTTAQKPKPKRTAKPNNLRPMNKFETNFVVTVAKAWIEAHPGADKDELVDVVRALSIGIRS